MTTEPAHVRIINIDPCGDCFIVCHGPEKVTVDGGPLDIEWKMRVSLEIISLASTPLSKAFHQPELVKDELWKLPTSPMLELELPHENW